MGHPTGCFKLAEHYDLVEKDYARALPLYERACGKGENLACSNLGFLFEAGHRGPDAAQQAERWFRRACTSSTPQWRLTSMKSHPYYDQAGIQMDPRRARRFREVACALDDGASCSALGVQYATGDGVTGDEVKAEALYQKACSIGDSSGCFNLGESYEYGRVQRDPVKAARLYDRACGTGHSMACANLAFLYEAGIGVAKDAGFATHFIELACKVPEACLKTAQYYEEAGFWRDPKRARRLYQVACTRGVSAACAQGHP